METNNKLVIVDVIHDGDFYHKKKFKYLVSTDESELFKESMECLKMLNDTIKSSIKDISYLKKGLERFVKAYESGKTEYYDLETDNYFDVKNNILDFELSWGNWLINVMFLDEEDNIEFGNTKNGIYLNFREPS